MSGKITLQHLMSNFKQLLKITGDLFDEPNNY